MLPVFLQTFIDGRRCPLAQCEDANAASAPLIYAIWFTLKPPFGPDHSQRSPSHFLTFREAIVVHTFRQFSRKLSHRIASKSNNFVRWIFGLSKDFVSIAAATFQLFPLYFTTQICKVNVLYVFDQLLWFTFLRFNTRSCCWRWRWGFSFNLDFESI